MNAPYTYRAPAAGSEKPRRQKSHDAGQVGELEQTPY